MIYSVIKKNLVQGTKLTCPRCKNAYDLLEYTRMQEIEEFEHETVPIYKCKCKWMFAPSGVVDHEMFDKLYQKLEELLEKS